MGVWKDHFDDRHWLYYMLRTLLPFSSLLTNHFVETQYKLSGAEKFGELEGKQKAWILLFGILDLIWLLIIIPLLAILAIIVIIVIAVIIIIAIAIFIVCLPFLCVIGCVVCCLCGGCRFHVAV